MKPVIVAACLLALVPTACGSSNDDVLTEDAINASQSAPDYQEAQADLEPETQQNMPADGSLNLANDASAVGPANAEMPAEPIVATIPPEFLGLWGMSAQDCASGDQDRALEISEKDLLFTDRVGHLRRILDSTPGHLTGVFGFEDQNRRWISREQLLVTGNGTGLVRASDEGRSVYRRCV
jgi:hypothetical protein